MAEHDPLAGYVSPMPAHVVTPEMLRRPEKADEREVRMDRHQRLAELIRQWADEDPEYNQRVGAILERELYEERYGHRRADDPAA